jgi:Putative Flp pilus-assembly TadE/G-like
MGRSQGGRSRDEQGSVLVLFAVFITLFLLCTAIVVDVGYWWANGKKAQIAADACALAAAQELPKAWGPPSGAPRTDCDIAGLDWVMDNIPDQGDPDRGADHLFTRVVSPYDTKSHQVEATVRLRVNTFFGRIVGLPYVEVERRAVAERSEDHGNMAIYSHDDNCSEGLEFNGLNHNINGLVHSNGEYAINNSGPEPFWAADGTRVDCGASVNPHGSARFGGDGYCCTEATLPRELDEELDWPVWFTPADFGWLSGCTYNGEEILVKSNEVEIKGPPGPNHTLSHSGTVPTGTYCASKSFKIDANNISGTITALSPLITVNGDGQNLQPHRHNVLLFSVANKNTSTGDDGDPDGNGPLNCELGSAPNPEMQLDGNHYTWTGILFNPCGRINVNVAGSSVGSPALVGTIIGMQVKVNGPNFSMIGQDDFGLNVLLALVE